MVDDTVTIDGVSEGAAFLDGKRERLFAVDVFAVLGGGDRRHGVPTVAGRDENHIDILALEEFVHVDILVARRVAVDLIRVIGNPIASRAAHVADRFEMDVFAFKKMTQVFGTAAADTDRAHIKSIAWRNFAVKS